MLHCVLTLPAGSKDLTQLVLQSKQGGNVSHQSTSHLSVSSNCKLHTQVRQLSPDATAAGSLHVEQHKDTLPQGVLNSDGTPLPSVCKVSTSVGNILSSVGKVSASVGIASPVGGKVSPSLGQVSPSAIAQAAASSSQHAPQVVDTQNCKPASSAVRPDARSQLQITSNVHPGKLVSSNEEQMCALPYVLFAIDGTWQETKEIYKVCGCCYCLSAA